MILNFLFIKLVFLIQQKQRYNMKYYKFYLITILFFIFGRLSAQDGGFYLGGSVGSSFINQTLSETVDGIGINDFKIDQSNFAYKIFGGFRLNKFLALEGGYRNTGKAEDTFEGIPITSKTKGWDVEAVGVLDLEVIFAFAKAGAFFWNTENGLGEEINKVNKTGFLWGVGAGVKLGGISIRAEWESLGTDNPESLSMLTAGVTFGF